MTGRPPMAAHDHGPFRPASVHPAFTLDALRRAWRKVRAAGGGAGADGVAPSVFEQRREAELLALHVELSTGRYRPGPIRRLFIPKADGGVRPLVVWTLRDRVAQRAVHDYLEPCFEAVFLDCSHGYRPGRSVSTAVRAVVAGRDRGCAGRSTPTSRTASGASIPTGCWAWSRPGCRMRPSSRRCGAGWPCRHPM